MGTGACTMGRMEVWNPRAMRGGPTSFNGERMVMQSDGWAFWPNTGTNGHDQETKDRETMTVDQAKAYCRSNDDWCVGFEYGTGGRPASLRGLRCSDISLTQLCGAGTIYFKNMLVQDGNTLGSWPGPGNGLYMFNPIYVQAGAWGTVCGDWVWNNNNGEIVILSRFACCPSR